MTDHTLFLINHEISVLLHHAMSEYSTKKVSELRDECARRYLPRSGCRKALQIRLVDHDKWYSKNAPRTIIEPFAEIYPNGTGSFGAKIVDPAILVGECK